MADTPTRVTLYNELLQQSRQNVAYIFCWWRDFSRLEKYNDHPIILFIEVESIFGDWNVSSSSEAILYDNLTNTEDSRELMMLREMFKFLKKSNSTCGVILQSKQETFHRPVFVINFGILLGVPDALLTSESDVKFALKKLDPHSFDDTWDQGVIGPTCKFFEVEQLYYNLVELRHCKDEILGLIKIREFFVSDITNKLDNPDQHGFGWFSDASLLYGFALFSFKDEDVEKKTVQLHIEYLCTSTNAPRGTGLQMTLKCVSNAQNNKFPGYTITAYAEAKPTEQAINFWSQKMGFEVDRLRWFEGAYYPSSKSYGGNYLFRD